MTPTKISHSQSSLNRRPRTISSMRFSIRLSFLLKRTYLGLWNFLARSRPSRRCRQMRWTRPKSQLTSSFATQKGPVAFWVYNKLRWPRLARMALDIYGIPPTEADNERLYSRTGDMVTKKRNRLSAATIGAIQCLRQWDEDEIITWRPQ